MTIVVCKKTGVQYQECELDKWRLSSVHSQGDAPQIGLIYSKQ